jgi:hypothetical protein
MSILSHICAIGLLFIFLIITMVKGTKWYCIVVLLKFLYNAVNHFSFAYDYLHIFLGNMSTQILWTFLVIISAYYRFVSFLLFILLLCLVGISCSIYKGSYSTSNTLYLNSSPPPFTFIYPPIPGIVSAGIFFLFTFCVHSICTIFTLLHPFPTFSPPPKDFSPPRKDLFCSYVL